MNKKVSAKLQSRLNIFRDLGYVLTPKAMIMDFGCGSGATVQELRSLGYQSFGCDFEFKQEKGIDTEALATQRLIRLVDTRPYKLPFDDDTFDVVISDQVFEHVQDYPESISEINRILKPDGFCLHVFPARYKLIEPHVYVPLATVVRSSPWLYIWAALGIRNEHQGGLSVRDTVDRNKSYLSAHTNYLPKQRIREYFREYFSEVDFCEQLFLKYSARGRHVYTLSKYIPFIPALYSTVHSRVVYAGKPVKNPE